MTGVTLQQDFLEVLRETEVMTFVHHQALVDKYPVFPVFIILHPSMQFKVSTLHGCKTDGSDMGKTLYIISPSRVKLVLNFLYILAKLPVTLYLLY